MFTSCLFFQCRSHDYNKFLPLSLHSPSEPLPSPRYVAAPKSPLPPIPGYPPGYQVPKTGLTGFEFPKLQEQDASENPDSEGIYDRIDESLFEEYESSYIYQVDSVPEKPANGGECTLF